MQNYYVIVHSDRLCVLTTATFLTKDENNTLAHLTQHPGLVSTFLWNKVDMNHERHPLV